MKQTRILQALTAGLALAAGAALAQTGATDQAAAGGLTPGYTMGEIMHKGGLLMYPLIGLSILSLAMIVYFLVVIREEVVIPKRFIAAVRDLLTSGLWQEAQSASRANPSPIASVVGAALEYKLRVGQTDHRLLSEVVEGEGSRRATMMQNQIQYLADIGGIAPMMGLLGTVIGMLKAFNGVAYDIAKAKPVVLAGGVGQALITTVGGLVVAIPAMIAYAYFRGRSAKIISNLETVSAGLVGLMEREK
jgi:biopolymer transport protein ExbB